MLNARPKVSIGLPVYNGEKYLAETLDGILTQTYQDFELIISDNASTDRTPEICRIYVQKDQRIRYHRNEKNWARLQTITLLSAWRKGNISNGPVTTIKFPRIFYSSV